MVALWPRGEMGLVALLRSILVSFRRPQFELLAVRSSLAAKGQASRRCVRCEDVPGEGRRSNPGASARGSDGEHNEASSGNAYRTRAHESIGRKADLFVRTGRGEWSVRLGDRCGAGENGPISWPSFLGSLSAFNSSPGDAFARMWGMRAWIDLLGAIPRLLYLPHGGVECSRAT